MSNYRLIEDGTWTSKDGEGFRVKVEVDTSRLGRLVTHATKNKNGIATALYGAVRVTARKGRR